MESIKRIVDADGKPRMVTPCRKCKVQPKDLHRAGHDTHALECCICGARTFPCGKIEEATQAWDRMNFQPVEIALVEVITKRPRLSLAR